MKSLFAVIGKILLAFVFAFGSAFILSLPAAIAAVVQEGTSFQLTADHWLNDYMRYAQVAAFIYAAWQSYFLFGRKQGWPLGWSDRGSGLRLGKGLLLGALAITAVFLLILATGAAQVDEISSDSSLALGLLGWLAFFAVAAFSEEIFCRGYLQGLIKHQYGFAAGLLGTSVIFALLHGFNSSVWDTPWSIVNLFLAGIFLGILREVSGSLWLPFGAHLTWNYFQGSVFGFPVSGMDVSPLLKLSVSGADALSGGSFGAEGSVMTTIVLAALSVWLYARKPAIAR